MTRNARRTWLDSFYDAQPADLPEAERRRRAKLAIKARMAGLALKSSMVRAQRKKTPAGFASAAGVVEDSHRASHTTE